ncbi:Oxygen tolerance [Dyella jiangningensis]|uniref:BatD family protein n=1 Tax=Dyella sp. AtDHG13 TaxID=1938897 RepID=UPI0008805CE9|nr:BatD family protein [Dyella sp. AtDHG13]PXV59906.1 oxygen tolerance protein BatD [Dyella sp. AtDHG13]SDJ18158.1 Oxygen tolerance [Dyella jiangningensis]
MRAWCCFLLWLCVAAVHADEPPPAPPIQVRVHQEPAGTLMQGETTRIVVDMLTPDFFTDAPVLPELHVDGAYLSLSDETPGHLVETVDGQSWSGVSRTYLITPLMSGPMEIPSFEITAHIGAARTPVAVQTPPLALQVQALSLPAGVTEALIASSVKITQTVTPQDGGLHVGDTVTRRIEISAEGAPAMMLPPTVFAPVSGLTLYAASPVTRDAVDNHGGFVGGSRVDTASYVIDHRGRYSLPPVTVRWMDSRTREWRESTVPAVHFHAWWGSTNKPRFALPQRGFMPRLIEWLSSDAGIGVLLLAVLAWLAWRFRDTCQQLWQRWKAWRHRRRHAEAAAFRAITRQRHAASAKVLAEVVDAWVRRAADDGAPTSVAGWATRYGEASLLAQWNALQDALYGKGTSAWSASALTDALGSARHQWKHSRSRWRRRPELPPLNPAS